MLDIRVILGTELARVQYSFWLRWASKSSTGLPSSASSNGCLGRLGTTWAVLEQSISRNRRVVLANLSDYCSGKIPSKYGNYQGRGYGIDIKEREWLWEWIWEWRSHTKGSKSGGMQWRWKLWVIWVENTKWMYFGAILHSGLTLSSVMISPIFVSCSSSQFRNLLF